ncbi:hypothetical protein Acr_17g0007810 [Actinidia rufa]|uniref:Association with the SNF1 complex (ASC) domain-containing protein n=1 Tax=Actinidia rufa TaxID=165716 RepID=A0A7J0G355_9ERIC|nr:hypothetical protein Acr_17g0007810 [Actinidia rufa]
MKLHRAQLLVHDDTTMEKFSSEDLSKELSENARITRALDLAEQASTSNSSSSSSSFGLFNLSSSSGEVEVGEKVNQGKVAIPEVATPIPVPVAAPILVESSGGGAETSSKEVYMDPKPKDIGPKKAKALLRKKSRSPSSPNSSPLHLLFLSFLRKNPSLPSSSLLRQRKGKALHLQSFGPLNFAVAELVTTANTAQDHGTYVAADLVAEDEKIAANLLVMQNDFVPEVLDNFSGSESPSSPVSTYNNSTFRIEDFNEKLPELPPLLQQSPLDQSSAFRDSHESLEKPLAAVLNHLYIQKVRTGQPLVALSSTQSLSHKIRDGSPLQASEEGKEMKHFPASSEF